MNRLYLLIRRVASLVGDGWKTRSRNKLGVALLLALLPNIAAATWWNNTWHYMVPIVIPAAPVNSTIVVNANFVALLTTLGVSGTFDPNSPRIVRADNATLSTNQEFTDAVYNGATDPVGNGQGEVRFILKTPVRLPTTCISISPPTVSKRPTRNCRSTAISRSVLPVL